MMNCHLTRAFKITCLVLFTTQTGCIYESQTITGKVVDESGLEIPNVVVTVCHYGWGWSDNGLVWDKEYCSEPAITDNAGVYTINFYAPDIIKLRARKEGWMQTNDFWTNESRIVLINREKYLKREAAQRYLIEQEFKKRLAGESNAEYYCRVILSRSGTATLNYISQKIVVFQSIHKFKAQPLSLFAVKGTYGVVSAFANEAVLKINGKEIGRKTSLQSGESACQPDIYFIETDFPYSSNELNRRIEILVPSLKAMFDMDIWH